MGIILAQAKAHGARYGLWWGWMLSVMVLPAWLNFRIGPIQFEMRSAAAATSFLGFFLFPTADAAKRWVLADVLMAILFGMQMVSQYRANDLRIYTIMDVARGWLLPYLMGRWFLGSLQDIRRVLPLLCPMFVFLSVYAIVEAGIKVNPINVALGKTFGLLEQGEGYRMGLKRAQGPLDHPIFFGMMLVMLLPWAIEAARCSREPGARRWWRFVPWLIGGALLATVSRGPQIAAIATLYVTLFFRNPRWRPLIFGLAVSAAISMYVGKEVVQEVLGKMAGEKQEDVTIIMIDGEPTEYTGTQHRVLLFTVYADALKAAGYFGFGRKLEGVQLEESIAERFGSIDDHYMLFYLQHGWLGIGMFGVLALCSLYYLARLAWDVNRSTSLFAAVLFGALAGVDVLLVSVWLSPDFGSVWIFCTGLSATLWSLPAGSEKSPLSAVRRIIQQPCDLRRLSPGYAPVRSNPVGV